MKKLEMYNLYWPIHADMELMPADTVPIRGVSDPSCIGQYGKNLDRNPMSAPAYLSSAAAFG